ncbi:uncharacterized protein LOC116128432 [Pistacia vera]|uniref:uncharacterized protein LOC116128432 n=1 Tax=Pistacia vera TaxID=55513 RepID=UPI001262CBE7|nr:uncharacterized protein LOC116128432 [Pistacia vera]
MAYIVKQQTGMQTARFSDEQLQNHALIEIEDLIKKGGKTMADFHGIPIPNHSEFESIAALLLPGGRTTHSRFQIPLDITDKSTCDIKKGTQLADLIWKMCLIIWDDAPMANRNCFEALKRSLKDILYDDDQSNVDKMFGEIDVLEDESLLEIPYDLNLTEDCAPQETILNVVFPGLCDQIGNA